MPDEEYAYGIKRFDRCAQGRIHTEDFAQILGLYPPDKYQKVNYEQLGKVFMNQAVAGLKIYPTFRTPK